MDVERYLSCAEAMRNICSLWVRNLGSVYLRQLGMLQACRKRDLRELEVEHKRCLTRIWWSCLESCTTTAVFPGQMPEYLLERFQGRGVLSAYMPTVSQPSQQVLTRCRRPALTAENVVHDLS